MITYCAENFHPLYFELPRAPKNYRGSFGSEYLHSNSVHVGQNGISEIREILGVNTLELEASGFDYTI